MYEFVNDGTVKLTVSRSGKIDTVGGKYKFIDDNNLEIDTTSPDEETGYKDKIKIDSIDREKLVLSSTQGAKIELKRKS
jgi:hypothetical protein